MRKSVRLFLYLATGLLLAFPATVLAEAPPPPDLPEAVTPPSVDIAVDTQGNVAAVWVQNIPVKRGRSNCCEEQRTRSVLQAASKPIGQKWSKPANLTKVFSDATLTDPQVEITSTGTPVIAFRQDNRIKTASRDAEGKWAEPVVLDDSTWNGSTYRLVANAGFVGLSWISTGAYEGYVVRGAVRSPDGVWGKPSNISQPIAGESGPHSPRTAIDPQGVMSVVWLEGNIIKFSTQKSDGAWETPTEIYKDAANRPSDPELAANATGEKALAWTVNSKTIQAVVLTPEQGWSTPKVISGLSSSFNPQVAIDNQGNTVVAWKRGPYSNPSNVTTYAEGISYAAKTTNVEWSDPLSVIAGGTIANISSYQLAIHNTGSPLMAFRWSSQVMTTVTTLAPPVTINNNRWSDSETISDGQEFSDDSLPWVGDVRIASNQQGTTAAIWKRYRDRTQATVLTGDKLDDLASLSMLPPFEGAKLWNYKSSSNEKRRKVWRLKKPNKVPLRIFCSEWTEKLCIGKISLKAKLSGKERKIGKASFRFYPLSTNSYEGYKPVNVPIDRATLKLLKKERRLKVTVHIVSSDSAGRKKSQSEKILLGTR